MQKQWNVTRANVLAAVLTLGLALLQALLIFQKAGPSLMAVTRPLGIALVALALVMAFFLRVTPKKLGIEIYLYGAFVAYAAISGWLVAGERGALINMVMRLAQVLGMIAVVYAVTYAYNSVRPALWIMLICAVGMAVYGMNVGFVYKGDHGMRLTIGMLNPNLYASLMMYGVLCGMYLLLTAKNPSRVLLAPVLYVLIDLMLRTGSRKNLIVLAIGVAALLIPLGIAALRRRNPCDRIALGLCIALVAVHGVRLFTDETMIALYHGRMKSMVEIGAGSPRMRLEFYLRALELLKENPIWGVGLDQFQFLNKYELYSHSTYAEIFSCTGLVGAALYFGMYVSMLVTLIRQIRSEWKSGGVQSESIGVAALFLTYGILNVAELTAYKASLQYLFGVMMAFCAMRRARPEPVKPLIGGKR